MRKLNELNELNELEIKIINLKAKLQRTDYQAIKYAEGLISEEEYTSIKEQRQAWRDEINKLEEELKELREVTHVSESDV